MNKQQLLLKIDRARWFVLTNAPFYGQLMMGLRDVINPAIPTARTNGELIEWSPDFVERLSDKELRYVLLHETKHCADGHLWRFPFGGPNHQKANAACDHAINLTLNDTKLEIEMPKGGLAEPAYKGLCEEEIYLKLPDPPPGGGGDQPDVCGDYGPPADGAGEGTGDKPGKQGGGNGKDQSNGAGKEDSLKDKWERRVIQAAQAAAASGQGSTPADMQRILDKALAQPINWRTETADFIKSAGSMRNDWSRSARRHAWQRVIYPRKRTDDIGVIIVAVDTSGSISHQLVSEFHAIAQSAQSEVGCAVILMDCDAAIQRETRIAPGEPWPTDARGGGGTSFQPVVERAEELIEKGDVIAGIIYLTDGYGDVKATNNLNCPTLWLCTTDQVMPFGRTVPIKL